MMHRFDGLLGAGSSIPRGRRRFRLGDPTHPSSVLRWTRDPRRRSIAAKYLAGSGLLSVAAFVLGGMELSLLWPAVALAHVAGCYGFLGTSGFAKRADGTMPVAVRAALAPYLLGAWINTRLWTLRLEGPIRVTDDVWVGRFPSENDLRRIGAASVVDLTAEIPARRRDMIWHSVPMLDLVTPRVAMLRSVADAIERLRRAGPVLVSCAIGRSRSAAAVATWLLASGRACTAAEAVARLESVGLRPALDDADLRAIAAAGGEA